MAALLLTAEQVYAVKFRPIPGTVPWHESEREHKWFKPDHPVDYYVPNFGVDHDIVHTQKHIADTEGILGHKWNPKFDEENKAYIVPTAADNLSYNYRQMQTSRPGQSLVQSDPICSSAGCPKTKLKAANDYPKDYPVPNFGVDRDIITTRNSLEKAEGIRGHNWDWILKKGKDLNPAPTQYNFEPELDSDVVSTQKHMGDAETRLKTKWEMVQLNDPSADQFDEESDSGDDNVAVMQKQQQMAQSDPISSSVGWPKSKSQMAAESKIVSYPDPNNMKLE